MFFLGLVISIGLGILLQIIRPGKHSIKKILIGVVIIVICYCLIFFCIRYNPIKGITFYD